MSPRALELLAPARDLEVGLEAIRHGADAVYIGGPHHGARAAVGCSVDDISQLAAYAHKFRAKVYVTLNTLIYNDELASVQRLVWLLWRAGVDALIVQDLGLLKLDLPPIALHASTQCDIRTPRKARFLQDAGFTQLVLPREMSLEEIRAVAEVTTVPLEGFVHGALCVSYSGDCRASLLTTGRSANRGECAQVCRWAYNLVDGRGRTVVADRHLLSLRDMNRIARLGDMTDVGISSFKIEGRLKDAAYVKTVVAAYRQALDALIDSSEGRYCRASAGRSVVSFNARPEEVFNRGFTSYFLDGRPDSGERMASHATPKWVGTPIGKVKALGTNWIELDGCEILSNGDGLSFFAQDGSFNGFRVNRVEGSKIYPARMPAITRGTAVYRNHSQAYARMLAGPTADRRITLNMELRRHKQDLVLNLSARLPQGRCEASVVLADVPVAEARSSQLQQRRSILGRLGNTVWQLGELSDYLDNEFISASALTDLRRRGVEAVDRAMAMSRPVELRAKCVLSPDYLVGQRIEYYDNIANDEARKFVVEHGAVVEREALEVQPPVNGEPVRLMTTRYCLRRELGACLRTPAGRRLVGPLTLQSGGHTFRLDFDCKACQMHVFR